LEPEVHVVERWLQFSHQCLTATNVKAEGRREIDVLGYNPRSKKGVHVECSCKVGHFINIRKPFTHNGKVYQNELRYFLTEKFAHPDVEKTVYQFFGTTNYSRTLVVWGISDPEENYAASQLGIQLKSIYEVMDEVRQAIRIQRRGHRDDVLRILEFLVKDDEILEKWEAQMQDDVMATMQAQSDALGFEKIGSHSSRNVSRKGSAP
jgi:hypothetical protein